MWLFVIFVIVPIIEIALFIKVGGFIGLWPTLAIVFLTALAGSTLLRSQGLATLTTLQNNLRTGGDPVNPIAHGALILVAGVLLLTPGFFTDFLGLSLMVPKVRVWVIKWIGRRIAEGSIRVYSNTNAPPRGRYDDTTLDGDFTVIDDDPPKKGGSGWTKS